MTRSYGFRFFRVWYPIRLSPACSCPWAPQIWSYILFFHSSNSILSTWLVVFFTVLILNGINHCTMMYQCGNIILVYFYIISLIGQVESKCRQGNYNLVLFARFSSCSYIAFLFGPSDNTSNLGTFRPSTDKSSRVYCEDAETTPQLYKAHCFPIIALYWEIKPVCWRTEMFDHCRRSVQHMEEMRNFTRYCAHTKNHTALSSIYVCSINLLWPHYSSNNATSTFITLSS